MWYEASGDDGWGIWDPNFKYDDPKFAVTEIRIYDADGYLVSPEDELNARLQQMWDGRQKEQA